MRWHGCPPERSSALVRCLLLWIIAAGITFGAPVLRAAALCEENPEHQADSAGHFQAYLSGQTETRRRQPHVLPDQRPHLAGSDRIEAGKVGVAPPRRLAIWRPHGRAPPLA